MKTEIWIVFRYDHKTRTMTDLGRVRARHSPGAILAGLKKFKVPPADHRRIGARPLKPPPPPPPIPESERRELRRLSEGLRDLMRKHL